MHITLHEPQSTYRPGARHASTGCSYRPPSPTRPPNAAPHAAVPQPRLPQATVAPLSRRCTALQSGGRAVRPQAGNSPAYAPRCALWPAAAAARASGVLCTAPPSERHSVVTRAHGHVRRRWLHMPHRRAATHTRPHSQRHMPYDTAPSPHCDTPVASTVRTSLSARLGSAAIQRSQVYRSCAARAAWLPAAAPRHRVGAGLQVSQPTAGAAAMPGCA